MVRRYNEGINLNHNKNWRIKMSRTKGSKNVNSTAGAPEVAETTISSTTSVPVEQIKIVDNSDLKNQIINLESRINEIEAYRTPNQIALRVQNLQETVDSIDGRLQKVEALLKKAYAIEDNSITDVMRLKGNPATANHTIVRVNANQDGVPNPINAPKVSI